MAVLHDWKCLGHGVFEAYVGKCPHGCGAGMVQKIFLKAPGSISNKTKFTDGQMRALAKDFGVTDMNNRNGVAATDDFRWSQPNGDMLNGRPFSLPVKDVASFMGSVGAQDSGGNIVAGMKQSGQIAGLKANVVGSYNPKI